MFSSFGFVCFGITLQILHPEKSRIVKKKIRSKAKASGLKPRASEMESSSFCAIERFQEAAMGKESSEPAGAIDSNNKGFQLLKKHGWKEGTGLGITEQGRLEPVQAYLKNNKRGLGAEKVKKMKSKPLDTSRSNGKNDKECLPSKKSKTLSKRISKMQKLEKQLQEKEFERAFFREFWPDNV